MSHLNATNSMSRRNPQLPYMNESFPTYEWVMSHIWMNHVPHTNESCHTYEWVERTFARPSGRMVSQHTNESCHTYEWVMSHIWMIWTGLFPDQAAGWSATAADQGERVLQCGLVCCSVSRTSWYIHIRRHPRCRSVLQCAVMWSSVLQCLANFMTHTNSVLPIKVRGCCSVV